MLNKCDKDNFMVLKSLDKFMVGHKGFICGGCFKNIFNHEKMKDIDIFFKSEHDFEQAVEYFDCQIVGYAGKDKDEEEYYFYYENDNVKAYKHIKTNIVIELCCKIFGTPYDILNKFDFTLVKFAYYKEETDDGVEYNVLYDDKFFEHLHQKRLVIDKDIPYPMSTFERVLRYAKYGYFPCRETKMKIVRALRDMSDNQVEASESLYDGMD